MLFYIRIELDRSNVDGRSFQAHPDKMLHFQGLYDFRRDFPPFLNDCKTIENTGQTGFLRISDDSSHGHIIARTTFQETYKDALLAEL